MNLSDRERRTFQDMSAALGPLRVGPVLRTRLATRRTARRGASTLRRHWLPAAIVLFCAWMIVFAGLLFHNGYAAGAAGCSAAVCGFLVGSLHRPRRRVSRVDRRR